MNAADGPHLTFELDRDNLVLVLGTAHAAQEQETEAAA